MQFTLKMDEAMSFEAVFYHSTAQCHNPKGLNLNAYTVF